MASIRRRELKDGTQYWSVLYRRNGKQTSTSFGDPDVAVRFKSMVDKVGVEAALRTVASQGDASAEMNVDQWITHHIDHLTGVEPGTIASYRRYLKNDISPVLGELLVSDLSRDDVARWVQALNDDFAAKTVANKHAFLAGALASAVRAGVIAANPADGTRLPRGERREMVFLSREEFGAVLREVPEQWQPMVEFLVASGARWSEVTALKPIDVDRAAGTVQIVRAWKKGDDEAYVLGPPKTKKSRRTINIPGDILDQLDYAGEWLFTKPGRGGHSADGPVRGQSFRTNVWNPAVRRAEIGDQPRIHDLRHTCASWLIQAGIPLPVVQQHLGHESIQTTVDVYGHLDRGSMRAAADTIGKILAQ
ncbi:tyrosine-type recombinase/integrase [Mycobacteroides abscessus]|uniref:Integrase n=1 Tax=Mycobacteroides immunogenum TaxID=83262 RepID=A0A7V8LL37_9MYCO|nr:MULTISPECIES: site-specific integrase [Mycobacteroides]ANO03693.1 integrase [Mycobacteroides immunogenum]KIU38019.1 integrase [Mycobacteroides immunogenum]KPG04656.1 integrase [Mycobacteroides immunogenum]KPG05355.1 integrase [Mycobacteroides immunogenum]KPG06243.1 integrase [Mycobacteroides immunogenum]